VAALVLQAGIAAERDLQLPARDTRKSDKQDEKEREDRLRSLPEVRGFARWGTADLRSPERLRRILLAAGLEAGR